MKKTAILLFSSLMWIGITSCQKTKDKIDQLTEFDIPYSSNVTVVATSFTPAPSTTQTATADFTTPDVQTNSGTTFAAQKTATDKISEIKLTRLNITTNAGNFNYLKNVTIFIQATGQPEVQIATKTNIPDGLTSIDMDLGDVNVKNYVTGSTFKFRINVVADGLITSDQTITVSETLHVKATLL